jgi:hypothetical protein
MIQYIFRPNLCSASSKSEVGSALIFSKSHTTHRKRCISSHFSTTARVGHGFGSTRRVSGSGHSGTDRGSLGSRTRRNPLPDPRVGRSLRVQIIRLFSTILSLSSTVSEVRDCGPGHIICDCTNLGMPCHHFYTLLRSLKSGQLMTFHLGLFNARYATLPSLKFLD